MAIVVFRAVLILSAAGGALAAVLLLLRPLTQRVLGGHFQYYAWLLMLLVLVLPVSLPDAGSQTALPGGQATTLPAGEQGYAEQVGNAPDRAATAAADAGVAAEWPLRAAVWPVLTATWLIGGIVYLCKKLLGYARFRRMLRVRSTPLERPSLSVCLAELGAGTHLRVLETEVLRTPLLMGLFHPLLYLPQRALDGDKLRFVLLHELTHYKRRDLWIKWIALCLGAIHWFNPLIQAGLRRMNEDCEISCDLAVTRAMDDSEKRGYMNTILSLLAGGGREQGLTTAMAADKGRILRRFTMIERTKKKSVTRTAAAWVLTAVLLTGALLSSGAMARAVGTTETESGIEIYNGAQCLTLQNAPFVEGGELYLPLRETLDALEPCGVQWDNGRVIVTMPAIGDESRSVLFSGVLEPGARTLILPEQDDYTIVMRGATLLKNGVTYVTTEFMEYVFDSGHIPDYRVEYILPRQPEAFIAKGEEAFIGTMAQQDAYSPVDEYGASKLVKRIIVDDEGLVYAVATVENQQPEVIARTEGNSGLRVERFQDMYWGVGYANSIGGARLMRTDGIVIQRDGFAAYIPPACQVASPWG